jgi:hypothetical protein
MEKPIYGAPVGAWDHFDVHLDLTTDLLPVVSNPNAVKSPLSKIAGPGKTPSVYNARGQMAGFPKWTEYRATMADVSKWAKQKDYGICLQTRLVRALDVDISDMEEAMDVEAFIDARLGIKLPARRRRNSTKFLMPFVLPGDLTKRRFKTKTEGNFVELLATGQQFVACGTHTSGVPYEWDGGLPDSIPELSREEFEALWAALHEKFGSEESITVKAGMTPTKKRRLEDANDPVGPFLEENWTVHDVTDDGRVDILCPWHEGHSSESGISSTSWFLGGVGGFAIGHFRCLHTSCAHRTDQEFLKKIGYLADGFEVIDIPDTEYTQVSSVTPSPLGEDDIVIGPQKEYEFGSLPQAIIDNKRPNKPGATKPEKIIAVANAIFAALDDASLCGHGIAYDRFRDEVMITENVLNRPLHMLKFTDLTWRPFRDDDYIMLKMRLERAASFAHAFEPLSVDIVRLLVKHVAQHRSFDSLEATVSSYKWDGKPRVANFLRDFMGAEDSGYTRAVSVYYWTALAGRAVSPGIKADMVPIAVGDQGARKTTLIRAIAPRPDMFVELDLSKSDADLARDMRGKVVGELGEMKGFSAKMIEHIKAFITREREEWTPKYCEFTTKYLRRCIFFGTTNDDEPLPPDSTGNRRWLPFKVADGVKCDVEQLSKVKEQLWAEALVLFNLNGVMWQEAERLAPDVHQEFEKEDAWTEHLRDYLFAADMGEAAIAYVADGLKLVNVVKAAFDIQVKDINRAVLNRAADAMRKLGFIKRTRASGKVWVFDLA